MGTAAAVAVATGVADASVAGELCRGTLGTSPNRHLKAYTLTRSHTHFERLSVFEF